MIHYFTTSARGVHQWLQITSKLDDGVNISSNNGSKICDEHPVEDINNINRHFGHKSEATTHTHASTHSAGHATTQKRTFTSTQPHTHRTVADLCICGAYTRCVDNYNPKHHLDVDIHSTDGEAVALHHMWAEARNSIARKSTEMLSVSFYKLADAIKADQDRKKGIGNVTGENRVTTIRSDTEMCACGEIKSRCVGNCQVVTELDNVRKYSSPVELSELKQFEGLRSLDQEESESIVDMLKHAGLNWMRIKMLAALSVDLQLEPKKEGDKLFMTEKILTSLVNKSVTFELGTNGEYGPYTEFYNDAFCVDVERQSRYDRDTGHLLCRGRSVGRSAGYIWTEDKWLDEDGTVHFVTELQHGDKTTSHHRVFKAMTTNSLSAPTDTTADNASSIQTQDESGGQ